MKRLMLLVAIGITLTACSDSKLSARKLFPDKLERNLAEAAAAGNTNLIDNLLSKGVDVNSTGEEGVTPLAWALLKQNKVGFEYLLKRGADPNVRLDEKNTLLFYAVKMEDSFFLETALKHGGDPNQRKKWLDGDISLLWYTTTTAVPKPDKVKILIQYGADVNEQRHGNIISSCAMKNDYENVYIFLEAGAPFSTNREPSSLLYCLEDRAVHPDDPEYAWRNKVVDFLRERGIEVNPKEWKRKDQPTIINVQTNLNITR